MTFTAPTAPTAPAAAVALRAAAQPSGLELAPGRPESLDGEMCRRLFQAGIHTIPDLCQAHALELGRATGIGYSRVRRLQFLASRIENEAPAAQQTTPEPCALPLPRVQLPRFSAADNYKGPTVPVVNLEDLADEGAGGPFAQ
jgi:hypothetical protein